MFTVCIFSGFPEYMLESLSVKHTGRFCIFACSPRSQVPDRETPSESGRLGITMYAFSTQTQTSSRTSTLIGVTAVYILVGFKFSISHFFSNCLTPCYTVRPLPQCDTNGSISHFFLSILCITQFKAVSTPG